MTELYVGGLPLDVREQELYDLFEKYQRGGRIDRIKVMPPKFRDSRATYAFVMFQDDRDAMEAQRGRDRIKFADNPISVQISKSQRRDRGDRRDRDRGDRRDRDRGDRRDRDRGGRRDRDRGDRRDRDRGDRRDRDRGERRDRDRGGRRDRGDRRRERRPDTVLVFVDNLPEENDGDAFVKFLEEHQIFPYEHRINRKNSTRATMRFETMEAANAAVQKIDGVEMSVRDTRSMVSCKVAPPRGGENKDRGRNSENRNERNRERSRSPVRDHGEASEKAPPKPDPVPEASKNVPVSAPATTTTNPPPKPTMKTIGELTRPLLLQMPHLNQRKKLPRKQMMRRRNQLPNQRPNQILTSQIIPNCLLKNCKNYAKRKV